MAKHVNRAKNNYRPRKILVRNLDPSKPEGTYYSVDLNRLKHPELWEGLVGIYVPEAKGK